MNRYKFDSKNHIHLLDEKPLFGTSTVVGVIAKPLTWWASGMACSHLGWSNHKIKNKFVPLEERLPRATEMLNRIKAMEPKEYLALLDCAYRAHKNKLDSTAEAGTDLHAQLESYVKQKMAGAEKIITTDRIKPFIDWCDKNVKEFLWSEAHCYSETIWCGGISDVGAVLKDGRTVIIDFKSSKEAYESQFIQAAGYDLQMQENGMHDCDGNLIRKMPDEISAYFIFPFGSEELQAAERTNVKQLREAFKAAVVLHGLLGKD